MTVSISRRSPNFDSRGDAPVDMIVLHYTGMPTAADALDRLCDPAAKVSAHYLIEPDGLVHQLVDEDMRAWHAGVSCWRGHRDVNARSIGIELVNPGHEYGYRAFPLAQMKALAALAGDLMARYDIPARNVVGHSDVAPDRKQDPGELFDWRALAAIGIGLWPSNVRPVPMGVDTFQHLLAEIGYDSPVTGRVDEPTKALIAAFQRHYRPSLVDGLLDGETAAIAAALHRLATACDKINLSAGRPGGRAAARSGRISAFPSSAGSYPA